jgi:DNA-binding response OmpR family regulator
VLLVEDEGVLRSAVAKMLRNQGFRVMEASDGAAGLDLFRNNKASIDAILLDMTLPKMSGSEVFAAIRELRPDAHVILTSAYGREALKVEISPWAYIRKPYRTSELTDLLLRACRETLT